MMHTDDEAPPKKKSDKSHTSTENLTVSVEKLDTSKKSDKGESEDPKPRIVLTFRSEKYSAKSSNMKIVSTEEKHEESTPRRSSRTRSKWEWICDSDPSALPKKDKIISQSENDESDSSYTPPRLRRRRSKDDVMANAIARKEKSYNESALAPTQRLSRRIKPTAKILANEELRIGLECQNNARLGLQTDKSPEEGVRTRRSAKPLNVEETKPKEASEVEVVEIDDDSQSQTSQVMKLKHLCELGLKAINPEAEDEDSLNENRDENEAEVLDDEEIDDDSEVISKLLEADEDTVVEDSDEDFYCSEEASQSEAPRRSTRLCSSYGANDSDRSSPPPGDEEQKTPRRRSSRRAARQSYTDTYDRPKRKRNRSCDVEDAQSGGEQEETSNPAGGDEGAEAVCPEGESTIVATCLCEKPDFVFAAPSDLTEPVFCQAIELVDGIRVGCSHAARKEDDGTYSALVRAGPRAPFFLACMLHTKQLRKHMCCPACGLFCSQGVFFQCSEGHLFHLECGLPYNDAKSRPGCPHCGVSSYRWQPANRECCKVKVEMKCSNKRIFLPDQREQCTPAYLGFSTLEPSQLEHEPVIPEDLLPSVDIKQLFEQAKDKVCDVTAKQLCDAILAGDPVEKLIPMIASGVDVNRAIYKGGTAAHASAGRGRVAALHALALAGADLDALDAGLRTPLMIAVLALLDKSENKSKEKLKDISKDSTQELETDQSKEDIDKVEEKDDKTEKIGESEIARPNDEDLMKVIRYLVAAGCDVNISGPEGLTALHMAAQGGSRRACRALLRAPAAAVQPRDHGGWTPLVWAAENDHAHLVRLLVSEGAAAAAVDREGNQAVHWCALAGAARALHELLHAAPATLHAPNNHSDTPLHIAARQGHYACVIILLARGARTDIENSAGELPVDVCSGQCKDAILLNMQMKLALADKFTRKRLLNSDISNGRELHPIPCVNEIDDAPEPDDFTYVTSHVTPAILAIDNTIQSLQGCSCAAGAGACAGGACACTVLSVRHWYSRGRLPPAFPFHDPPMLFECNQTCGCNAKTCENRVVSNLSAHGSMGVRVQVFRAAGARGWGLRAAPGRAVPRGSPVALYCGELLDLAQADTRTKDYYMFALDVKPDLLEQCPDKTQLCVDAAQYGSAARFINHSCSPNLAPVRVFTSTRDLRLPTVTLFATKDIQPLEELTFDYGDKFWSVKSKYMNCECGSIDCKYPVKSTEETES